MSKQWLQDFMVEGIAGMMAEIHLAGHKGKLSTYLRDALVTEHKKVIVFHSNAWMAHVARREKMTVETLGDLMKKDWDDHSDGMEAAMDAARFDSQHARDIYLERNAPRLHELGEFLRTCGSKLYVSKCMTR